MKRARFAAAALAAAVAAAAQADGGRRVALDPLYVQECASCHAPFPPGLLPAESWQRLLGGLGQHFGTDASLEPAAQAALARWLPANAATRRMEVPAEDRITRTRWFQREHGEVPVDAWRRPAVKRAANCAACHPGAAEGIYSEHQVRIPR